MIGRQIPETPVLELDIMNNFFRSKFSRVTYMATTYILSVGPKIYPLSVKS